MRGWLRNRALGCGVCLGKGRVPNGPREAPCPNPHCPYVERKETLDERLERLAQKAKATASEEGEENEEP